MSDGTAWAALAGWGAGLVTRYGVQAIWVALKILAAWLKAKAAKTPGEADDAMAAAFAKQLGDKPPE